MKIYSWNVNGIRAVEKKGAFSEFIETHAPDILCLQETKAKPEQVAEQFSTLYPEYKQFWYSADKSGYSGTAIFTKIPENRVLEGIPLDIVNKYQLEDIYGDTSKEGRVLTIDIERFYITTVYTPNAKEDLSRIKMRQAWDPAFLEYVKLLEKEKPVIHCGDYNVAHTEQDLARPKENKGKKGFTEEEREGFENILNSGFIDTFRMFHEGNGHYTWWSHFAKARERNVGWRIDYVLASETLRKKITAADIHSDVFGSDHCPVSVSISF